MKYKALYRETRPEVFSDVLGQEHVVRILRNQIAQDQVSHAYLFCGTRGTGKTSIARILAKAVNCTSEGEEKPCGVCPNCQAIKNGSFLDVIEIDAASNNGVDNIRDLRESVNYPPVSGKKKVYIIDEVHMLSTGAFNALLKTLEEPPAHVMFILATTNPEKMPETVLSRCLRLDFRRVPARQLAGHMRRICESRGIEVTDEALNLLTASADGSVRDSLSILEQCIASGEGRLDRQEVLDFLGAAPREFFIELTDLVMTGSISDAFLLLDRAILDGKDVRQLMKDWMSHLRDVMISRYVSDADGLLDLSPENAALVRSQSERIDPARLTESIMTLARAVSDARYSSQARILLEVAIVEIGGAKEAAAPAGRVSRSAPAPGRRPAPGPGKNPAPAPVSGQTPAAPSEPRIAPASPPPSERTSSPAPVSGSAQGASPAPKRAGGGAPTRGNAAPPAAAYDEPQDYVPAPWEIQPLSAPPPDERDFYQEPVMERAPAPRSDKPARRPEPENAPPAAFESELPPFDVPAAPVYENVPAAPAYEEAPPAPAYEQKAESPAPAPAPHREAASPSQEDLSELWQAVLDEAVGKASSLNMARTGVFLAEMNDNQYKLIVSSPFTERILLSYKDLLDDILDRRTGTSAKMVIRKESDSEKKEQAKDFSEIADKAAELFGVRPRLK